MMEVFQLCIPEAFCKNHVDEAVLDEELASLNLNGHVAETFHKLFDLTYNSASTPNTARTAEHKSWNDSGFNDSFSSDSVISEFSISFLNDVTSYELQICDDEQLFPKLSLLSKFDDSDEHSDSYLDEPSVVQQNETSDCYIHNDEPHCSASSFANLSDTKNSVTEQLPCHNVIGHCDRTSSTRRHRSPAPLVERRSRHRLSLDSYKESCSEYCQSTRRYSEPLPQPQIEIVATDCSSRLAHPSDFKAADNIDSFVQLTLTEFAPHCLDQLIGRKMGSETVDFFFELINRSMAVVVDKILNYVSESDLCRMSMVSWPWHSAVNGNQCSVGRRESFINTQRRLARLQKQNIHAIKDCSERLSAAEVTSSRDPLTDVQSNECRNDVAAVEKQTSLAQRFWQEASKLRHDERLTKCPHCSGPSRTDIVQERATCTSVHCQYDFCVRCLSAFHGSRTCPSTLPRASRRTEPCIGSRQSRRNLRRL